MNDEAGRKVRLGLIGDNIARSRSPADPMTIRIAASRFSNPQQSNTPAQCEGTRRR